jgi:hypothetical protein
MVLPGPCRKRCLRRFCSQTFTLQPSMSLPATWGVRSCPEVRLGKLLLIRLGSSDPILGEIRQTDHLFVEFIFCDQRFTFGIKRVHGKAYRKG